MNVPIRAHSALSLLVLCLLLPGIVEAAPPTDAEILAAAKQNMLDQLRAIDTYPWHLKYVRVRKQPMTKLIICGRVKTDDPKGSAAGFVRFLATGWMDDAGEISTPLKIELATNDAARLKILASCLGR